MFRCKIDPNFCFRIYLPTLNYFSIKKNDTQKLLWSKNKINKKFLLKCVFLSLNQSIQFRLDASDGNTASFNRNANFQFRCVDRHYVRNVHAEVTFLFLLLTIHICMLPLEE